MSNIDNNTPNENTANSNNSNQTATSTEGKTCARRCGRCGGKRKWIVGGLIVLASIFAFKYFGGHHGHRDYRGHGGWSEGMMQDRSDKMVERFGKKVDATDEQKVKLKQIATAASAEVMPMKAQMKATADEMVQLLTAPTIDRAAVELLRSKQLAQMDTLSKSLANDLADAAEVLTPEQRAKLADDYK